MLTYLVLKKDAFYAGIRIFDVVLHSSSILINDKTKFKVALKKYLNTHAFYSVD